MLIEHLRSLPELRQGENCRGKAEYQVVDVLLASLFRAKYPSWREIVPGYRCTGHLPNDEGANYEWMLRNCAGRAPGPDARGA